MNLTAFPKEPPLELPHEERRTIVIHMSLKQAIDKARPKGLHGHQWIYILLLKGLEAHCQCGQSTQQQ